MESNFSKVNWLRCTDPEGFNADPGRTYTDRELNMFLCMCLTEELGEMVGALKKLIRGFNAREFKKTLARINKEGLYNHECTPEQKESIKKQLVGCTYYSKHHVGWNVIKGDWHHRQMGKVKEEYADLVIYLDLLRQHNQIDEAAVVKEKFNRVSIDMECPQFVYYGE